MNQLVLDLTNTTRERPCGLEVARSPGRKAEPARARRSDPETSQRAASRVERFAGGHFAAIVAALKHIGAGTYREIADEADMERHAVARRLKELETAGLVRRTDREFEGCAIWEPS